MASEKECLLHPDEQSLTLDEEKDELSYLLKHGKKVILLSQEIQVE